MAQVVCTVAVTSMKNNSRKHHVPLDNIPYETRKSGGNNRSTKLTTKKPFLPRETHLVKVVS